MNYLAHAYLSFNQPDILVGNMISDFVKGKKRFDYSEGIQKGIMLHRAIDIFTDDHAVTKQAKEFFKPAVGLYAGAFVDVVYDHFLALDTVEFNAESLWQFALYVYATLDKYDTVLPEPFAQIFPYMKQNNWLYTYKTIEGTQKSFGGLVRRAKYLDNSDDVFECFQNNYQQLRTCYEAFFPEVKNFALSKIEL